MNMLGADTTPTMRTDLLQTGIYTVPEASRLAKVSRWRIRRWLKGYEFPVKHGRHRSPEVWKSQLFPLGFLDLLEVRCVNAFITAGVSWKTLRQVHSKAQGLLGHTHPFCTNRFATDGQRIFMEVRERTDEVTLWDMPDTQRVFESVIRPFLKEIEFDEGEVPCRWWPLGRNHLVALDPRRSFGQPIILRDGVPTTVLARSLRANGSAEEVARWFEISPASVSEAVKFEDAFGA